MMLPTKARTFNSLMVAMTTMTVTVLACMLWAIWFEQPFLSYTNVPFPAPPSVRAGQTVELVVARCNRSHRARSYLTTHAVRNVSSQHTALLPPVWVDVMPGCTEAVSRINEVPANLLPGRYVMTGVALVPGIVVDHQVPWESQPFDVLPAAPAREN